jgi:uncharacterized membrane protein YbhN (UPF0104 family)
MMFYVALTIWSGLDRLQGALTSFQAATYLPAVVGLVILGWLLRALRWHYYVRYLSLPVSLADSILAFLASFALTATPGKGGEVVKAALLRSRYGIAVVDVSGVLLIERLGDLLAVLALAVGGLGLFADAWLYFLICLIGVGGVTAFVTSERLYHPAFSRLTCIPRLKPVASKFLDLFDVSHSLLRVTPFAIGLSIAMISWACEALAFYVILEGFGLRFPLWISFSVYGVSTVIGALSMLPGGVGGVEAAMLLLLTALDANAASAVASVLLTRFSTLWLISLLGFVFMGIWWLTERKKPITT